MARRPAGRGGWRASRWWPPIWPSPSGPGSPALDHATRVADPFHVVRVGNRCVDTGAPPGAERDAGPSGPQGRPALPDPQALLAGTERLDQRGHQRMLLGLRVGDPHDEVLGAWLAKESVRDLYLTDDPADAATLLDKAIAGCARRRRRRDPLARQDPRVVADRDPRPPRHRRQQRPHRGAEPVREEGQALRPRLPLLRALPAPRAPPRRRRHLARPAPTAPDQNPHSLLKRVEPDIGTRQNHGTASAIPLVACPALAIRSSRRR